MEVQLAHPGRQTRSEPGEVVARWRDRADLDPGTIPEDISKLEWRLWQTRFEIYVKASTEGGNPSEALRQTSLQSKLDAFWHERISLAYSRDIADISCEEIIEEITKTIKIRHPVCAAQAELFRLHKAEGRSAARQYAHVKSLARDADLESLKPDMIMIIITLNSLDPKDSRLREKMLEAVGQGKEKMTDTVFLRLKGEHEAWLANNSDKATFKAKKAGVNKRDDTQSTKPACWCCGEEGHYKDRCPKKEKAFCKKCRNKGHYEKACKSKSRDPSS